jgi:Spy/CpxP family protein refolding chaperone
MRTVSLLAVLATAAALPLAAQQSDTTRAGASTGHMYGQMRSGHMMGGAGTMYGGMMAPGMMGGGMMMGPGSMAGWMMYGMGMDSTLAGSMMRNMAFMPQHLLAERESLKLTPAQVSRLEVIQQAMQSAHQAMWQQAMPHMRSMTAMMGSASPDTSTLKSDYDAASAAMSAAHWSVVNAAVQARAVLTEAQRRQVESTSASWASGWMMSGRGMGMRRH